MMDEIRTGTRIVLDIVIKQVNDNLHLESTATFNKQQQNGYKIATIEFIEDLDQQQENPRNNCAVLHSIAGVIPKLRNIVSLNLSHCNLTCIPKSFCILPLKHLNVSHNLLKSVPLCILSGLSDVEDLNLSHNEIRSFETEPMSIRKLIILNIEDNMLTNIPTWVLKVKCSKLETLHYSENDLTFLKKSSFATTTRYKLCCLYLRNCSLMDGDFNVLKIIRTLKILDIGNIGNKNCNAFSKLELLFQEAHFACYIENLSMSNVSLCYIPENVSNLKYLTRLNISNNSLTWLPDSVVGLRYLQYLNFSCNKVVRLPSDFNKLENLEELIGPYNSLAHVPAFNLQRLRCVDLYSNEISVFDLGLDNMQMADFEQNFIDTTRLPVNYTQCLNAFRTNNNNQNRLLNEKEETYFNNSNLSRSPSSCSSYTDLDDINFVNDQILGENIFMNQVDDDDEEQWDIIVEDKFANISLSDSEWTGKLHNKIVKKFIKTTEYFPDHIYEDAD